APVSPTTIVSGPAGVSIVWYFNIISSRGWHTAWPVAGARGRLFPGLWITGSGGSPQADQRVRPPGPPPFGVLLEGLRGRRQAKRGRTAPHGEIGRQEHVRVPDRAHRHISGGPRADPGQLHQPRHRLLAVGARLQVDLPVR